MFVKRIVSQWRRSQNGPIETEPRPHLVPTDDRGAKLVICNSMGWAGFSNLCPGFALVDGQWVDAYRFKELTDAAADEIVHQLEKYWAKEVAESVPRCKRCGTPKVSDLFKGVYCPSCNDWC
jgi:hypothetical protein